MKNKTRILHIRLSKEESDDLNRKVMISGLSKSSLIRLLIKGYEPREKPDAKFYEVTKELYAIGNNLNQLAFETFVDNIIVDGRETVTFCLKCGLNLKERIEQ